MTKLFNRLMSRRIELWHKEISTTLTAPGTVSTAEGIKIRSTIRWKTSVKILIINKVILVYLLVFDTILAAVVLDTL